MAGNLDNTTQSLTTSGVEPDAVAGALDDSNVAEAPNHAIVSAASTRESSRPTSPRNIPLPGSCASSNVTITNPSRELSGGNQTTCFPLKPPSSADISPPRISHHDPKVGTQNIHETNQPSPKTRIASGEGVAEPSPLWYKSQTIPHRYGATTRQEFLPKPPLRSRTFPTKLMSEDVKSGGTTASSLFRRTSFAKAATSISDADLDGNSAIGFSPTFDAVVDKTNGNTRDVQGKAKSTQRVSFEDRIDESITCTEGNAQPRSHVTPTVALEELTAKSVNIQSNSGEERSSQNDHEMSDRQHYVITAIPQTEVNMPPASPTEFEDIYASFRRIRAGDPARRQAHTLAEGAANLDGNASHQYDWLVEQLATHMPHLVNIRGAHCRVPNAGNVMCYEILRNGGLPRRYDQVSFLNLHKVRKFRDRIGSQERDLAETVRCRYILVEDLSPLIIALLGKTFWCNPEFFEEHLNRSGYQPNSYADPMPSTWNTSNTPKTYVSVRWFRPVKRKRIKPLSDLERDKLLMREGSGLTLTWRSETNGEPIFENKIRLQTNVFRREWPIVSDPSQAGWDGYKSTFPAAWEERVTIQVTKKAGVPVFIVLLDPLPTVNLSSRSFHTTKKNATSDLVPFIQAYSRAPMGPKLGLVDVFDGRPLTETEISMLGSNLASTNCTRDDLTSWLTSMRDNTDMDLMTGLLWIIHRDVIGFLHFVHTVLEEIGLHSTDDHIIQMRLTHWRNLITRFQTELPAMKLSILGLFEFLEQFQPLDQARGFIRKTIDEIDNLIDENERSYSALRADMSLLESKRAIDQAESVGKLTELGFIFIPISCIAGLFSMQVKPLSEPVPLSSFVIAAFLTIGIIFAIRLMIRSTTLIEYRRNVSRRIRLHGKLAPNAPIPTRKFLSYVMRDRRLYRFIIPGSGPFSVILWALIAFAVLMLPVIMLWTRNKHLDTGYKTTLTLVFFVFSMAVLYPLVKEAFQELYIEIRQMGRKIKNNGTADDISNTSSAEHSVYLSDSGKRHVFTNLARKILGKRRKRRSDAEALRTDSSAMSSVHAVRRSNEHEETTAPPPTRFHPLGYRSSSRKEAIARWQAGVTSDGESVHQPGDPYLDTDPGRHDEFGSDEDPAGIPLPPSAESSGQASQRFSQDTCNTPTQSITRRNFRQPTVDDASDSDQ